ncbi:hypothetical protein HFO49_36470 [Rhizobium leguminosarum]|uniref:hypothetical protein n=1 Tax=Rhizobium leguminosarum TaxID=384 RepID=UPI001C95A0C8|nr:hypothetical protein [Rhizobium leguminosarum]MBY5592821.1 hypothetical protein [Rhizobium leguminosarum]
MLELKLNSPARSVAATQEPHVLHYDAWLIAGGICLIALARQVFGILTPPAITPGRKHRADAGERRRLCSETLVASLAVIALSPARYTGLAVPLENAKLTRYDRRDFNADVLRAVIQEFAEAGLVTVEEAVFRERRTVVAPTARFRHLVVKLGVAVTDVARLEGRETIELWSGSRRTRHKKIIDYRDSPEADALRAEMATVNGVLNAADIRLEGNKVGPINLVRKFRIEQPNGPHAFDRHGRLYGGFWEDLPKDQRYLLTIGGEPVADLDFVSMFGQLAYCRQGVEPPEGDLYAIPGLEGYRKIVKRLMVSLFFRNSKAQRLPSGTKDALPEGWSMERFKSAAADVHPAIVPLFDTNVGFELMALESQILVGVLLELASQGIAALPMHDGIMVAERHKEAAVETMRTLSRLKAGRELPVVEKPIQMPRQNNSPLWSSRGGGSE